MHTYVVQLMKLLHLMKLMQDLIACKEFVIVSNNPRWPAPNLPPGGRCASKIFHAMTNTEVCTVHMAPKNKDYTNAK